MVQDAQGRGSSMGSQMCSLTHSCVWAECRHGHSPLHVSSSQNWHTLSELPKVLGRLRFPHQDPGAQCPATGKTKEHSQLLPKSAQERSMIRPWLPGPHRTAHLETKWNFISKMISFYLSWSIWNSKLTLGKDGGAMMPRAMEAAVKTEPWARAFSPGSYQVTHVA